MTRKMGERKKETAARTAVDSVEGNRSFACFVTTTRDRGLRSLGLSPCGHTVPPPRFYRGSSLARSLGPDDLLSIFSVLSLLAIHRACARLQLICREDRLDCTKQTLFHIDSLVDQSALDIVQDANFAQRAVGSLACFGGKDSKDATMVSVKWRQCF